MAQQMAMRSARKGPEQPYHEDGFPGVREVSHVLGDHHTHAVHQLGPGQPLAGQQLHVQGLKHTRRVRRRLRARQNCLFPSALLKEMGSFLAQ